MVVLYKGLPELTSVPGIRVASASAGIKKSGRRDVTLIELDESSNVAATFTRNLFCAAPVVLAKENLQKANSRYILINTGYANAGTGRAGYNDAVKCCQYVADAAGCSCIEVLPFSTGVIGEPLPVERINHVIPELISGLHSDGWFDAATAILTTDTVPKGASRKVNLSNGEITITGIAKGSGMIRPDMATMLAFVATDAKIDAVTLDSVLRSTVNCSFNRITVDGDTSTNDACVLMASGTSGVDVASNKNDLDIFTSELTQIMLDLAQQIVKDGEGATKFVSIEVAEGLDEAECSTIAFTIAHSPLVKTALFASDPNWGRILAALGRAGVVDLDLGKINIYLGGVRIVAGGEPDPDYTEIRGRQVMEGDEIKIRIDLGRGSSAATVWTCDLSYEYVKINAEYRT